MLAIISVARKMASVNAKEALQPAKENKSRRRLRFCTVVFAANKAEKGKRAINRFTVDAPENFSCQPDVVERGESGRDIDSERIDWLVSRVRLAYPPRASTACSLARALGARAKHFTPTFAPKTAGGNPIHRRHRRRRRCRRRRHEPLLTTICLFVACLLARARAHMMA